MFLICSSHNPICLLVLSIRFYKNKCRLHRNRNLPCSLAAYPSHLKCCLGRGKNPRITAQRKEGNALPMQVPFPCCAPFLVTMGIPSIHITHIFAHNEDIKTLLFWIKGSSEKLHSKIPVSWSWDSFAPVTLTVLTKVPVLLYRPFQELSLLEEHYFYLRYS